MATDVLSTTLDQVIVSRPEVFQHDNWQPWFVRHRQAFPMPDLTTSTERR